jgi:hypothetical protein
MARSVKCSIHLANWPCCTISRKNCTAGAICGNRYEEHWDLAKNSVDFYDLKGDLESVLDLTGKLSEIEFRAEAVPALHPGQCAAIYLHGERVGFIGVVHPELERKLDLNGRTLVFELEWNKVADRVIPQAQDVSRFPAVFPWCRGWAGWVMPRCASETRHIPCQPTNRPMRCTEWRAIHTGRLTIRPHTP